MRVRTITALMITAAASLGAQAAQAPQGRLVSDTLRSKALEGNRYGDTPMRPMLVYLPASYGVSAARRYPVVYLLHGYGGNEKTWVDFAPVKPAMDSLVRNGTVREMIVVMPSGRNVFGGSFYSNSPSAGRWEDFIADELVAYVDSKYRTIPRAASRGLAGHSMGGYGTFTIGMHRAGTVYSALYALSGCCTRVAREGNRNAGMWDTLAALRSPADLRGAPFITRVNAALAAAFSGDTAAAPMFYDLPFVRRDGKMVVDESALDRWVQHAPLDMIASSAERLKHLRGFMFDVGDHDELVAPAQLFAMDTALTRAGVPHVFETYEGTHTNRIPQRLAERVLPFFSRTLDFGDARRP